VNPLEIEVKARASSLEEVQQTLGTMGAVYVNEVTQEDTYFYHPCRNFEETDEAVRIRVSNTCSYLTYKGKKVDLESKTRDEIEILIEDCNKGKEILEKLGFAVVAKVTKIRRIYTLDEFTVCLDTVDRLGTFVEVEAHMEGEPETFCYEALRDEALNLLDALHLTERERKSYLELLLEQEC
jgi:adenylate cyclase class 2